MSDFDNFDDLDAVRDFRADVGLLTAEIDDRIRRRIIDLAIAGGLVDGTDGRDETTGAGSGVIELPANGGRPPTSTTSADSSSSDGSAAVVELHVAARPPARQPRWLVAAAAIVVVIVVAGVVLVSRRADDTSNPANQPSITAPSTTAVVTFEQLVSLVGGTDRSLAPGEFQQTVDRIEKPREGSGAVLGTEKYTLTQQRGAGAPRPAAISDAVFTPKDSTAGGEFDPPKPSGHAAALFEGLTYNEVRDLNEVADAQAMHQRVLDVQGNDVPPYTILAGKLGLLRLTITPPRAKQLLAQSLVLGGYHLKSLDPAGDTAVALVLASDTDAAADAETVTVTFDRASGVLKGWVESTNDGLVNSLKSNASIVE